MNMRGLSDHDRYLMWELYATLSAEEIAAKFEVHVSTVYGALRQYRENKKPKVDRLAKLGRYQGAAR